MFKDLREYLKHLEKRDLVKYIDVELDPVLEIPEMARRFILSRGPVVVFNKVKGYPGWRMISNIFRGIDSLKELFGVEKLEDLGERFLGILERISPEGGFIERLKGFTDVIKIGSVLPKTIKRGDFEDNSVKGGFEKVPIPKIWPKDGGRYITYGLVVTKDPDREIYNMGVYRVQVLDDEKGAIHWFMHKRASIAYRRYAEKGSSKMPAAIIVGVDPATMLVGALPVPYPIDKYIFTSILRGDSLELVDLDGLRIPAHAEVVFKGFISLSEFAEEGPFGDYRGYYDGISRVPLFRLEQTFYRDNPLYYFTIVGKPYMEDTWIGKAAERIFLPFIRFLFPEIVDMNLPPEGLFTGGIAFVSIRKRFPGHARKIMAGLWGLGLFSLVKIIIVVDEDVNVHDFGQILYTISTTVDPARDVMIIDRMPTDELDFVSRERGFGSKLGIDATRKLPEENYGRRWPEKVEPDPEVSRRIDYLIRNLDLEKILSSTW
ncbi:MAG: UbiD family decarboxylase [Sulfolobales archaeon]